MPTDRRAARALLAGVLTLGAVSLAPVAAADEPVLTVTVDGASYEGRDRDGGHWDRAGYSVRGLKGWPHQWFEEQISPGRSGQVRFTQAVSAFPDGYCVVYVAVPGAGEWHESSDDTRCTATDEASEPSSPPPSTSPTPEAEPSRTPSAPAEQPEPEPTTEAPEPAPEPEPTPTASPSPSPSATPSPTPSRSSAAPAPESSAAPVTGDGADTASWTPDESDDAILHGELWAAVGLGLAAAGLAAGAVVVWRARRGTI